MKILAVDDDSFSLELLTMIAARAGFTDISTASSGEMALAMLKQKGAAFDCLLLDIDMPDMDGIELCGLARALPGYGKTPIVMLTAMAEKDHIDRAFRAGATDYLNKPLEIVELHARLRMAEDMISVRQEPAPSRAKPQETDSDGPQRHASDLSDEVLIEGVKDLIEYTALRNYLMQLSRAGLAGSQVIAVKVDRIETIFARASAEEFLYALTEVADAISESLRDDGYMMAYAGNGTFVIVSNKVNLEASAGLEAEIQRRLDRRDIEYDNADPMTIEISIGNPIRPSASKTQRIRRTFDRAIARAEKRVEKKRSDRGPPNIRVVSW